MEVNPIGMQIAVPRTQETGKIQQIENNRPFQLNMAANVQVQKEERAKRESVTENENPEQIRLRREKEKNHFHEQKQGKNRQGQKRNSGNMKHPYKGRFVDYNG